MMTRDEILAVYAAGPEAVVMLVETFLARLDQQEQQIVALSARVKELEERLSQDSHNSHKPPSSDGLASIYSAIWLVRNCGENGVPIMA